MNLTYSKYFYNIFLEGISPKEKIQKYKINDPFLIQFVLRYGEEIDWSKIKNKNDIENEISSTLIPELRERLRSKDHPKTVLYSGENMDVKREIEVVRQAHPEHYEAIKKIVEEKGEEEVKRYITSVINKDKQSVLYTWLSKINENISSPVQRYLILKPIFDSTDSLKKKTPKPYIWMAVRNFLKTIDENPRELKNLLKIYEVTLSNELIQPERFKKIKTGNLLWIKIPGQKEDSKNFESNVETLMGLSCNIWCISGKTMATKYLENDGGFYLLLDVENKKPTALMAVRMKGKEIQEIRGELESQRFDPVEMESHLLELQEKENLDKYKVWEWINDEREYRKLDLKLPPEVSNLKKQVAEIIEHEILKKRGLEDPNQIKFDFFGDLEQTAPYIESILSQLTFSTKRPEVGIFIGDIGDIAEEFNDKKLKYIKDLTEGNTEIYNANDDGNMSFRQGDEIMSSKYTVTDVIKLLKENIDFNDPDNIRTVSIINEVIDEEYDDKQPYTFLSELASRMRLSRIDSEIEEIYDKVEYAYVDGIRQGIQNKMYDLAQEHLDENFSVVSGKYLSEQDFMIHLSLEEIAKILQDNDEETLMYELEDIVKTNFEDDYSKLDLDSAYYYYDVDLYAAAEAYRNM